MTRPDPSGGGSAPVLARDIEIGTGIPSFTDIGDYASAHLLVRVCGVPVDWIDVPVTRGVIEREVIHAALLHSRSALWPAMLDDLIATPADLPPISVIVCTRDRADELDGCLTSLAALDYPAVEIIVVDNASTTEATRETAARHGVRCVREPRPGLDNARNRGIEESSHGIIAFTDDDVRVDPQWLRGVARAFADPGVDAMTGLAAPALLDTLARRMFEFGYGGMGKGLLARTWDGRTLSDLSRVLSHHVGVGANMAYRRDVLDRIGRFDPCLDVGTPSHGGGDLDMFHRVLVHGGRIRYEPRALVWHRHRADLPGLRRQLYDNGRAFGVHLIRRFRLGEVSRLATARAAAGWLRWLAGRLVRAVRGREPLPLPLVLSEIRGAFSAPAAYNHTYRAPRA